MGIRASSTCQLTFENVKVGIPEYSRMFSKRLMRNKPSIGLQEVYKRNIKTASGVSVCAQQSPWWNWPAVKPPDQRHFSQESRHRVETFLSSLSGPRNQIPEVNLTYCSYNVHTSETLTLFTLGTCEPLLGGGILRLVHRWPQDGDVAQ